MPRRGSGIGIRGEIRSAAGRCPGLAFHVDGSVPERRLRPDIRDRGEFRRPARRVLGPDGSNARAAAAGNAALLQKACKPGWAALCCRHLTRFPLSGGAVSRGKIAPSQRLPPRQSRAGPRPNPGRRTPLPGDQEGAGATRPRGAPNPYRLMTAARIHTQLREALESAFPWLEQPASVRISLAERIGDWLRVAGFLFLVLLGLSIPGMVVAFISPWPRFLVLFGIAAALIYLGLYRMRAPLAGKGAPTRSGGLTIESLSFQNNLTSLAHPATLTIGVLLFLGIYSVVASVIATWLGIAVTGYWFDELWWPSFRVVALSLLSGVFFTLPAIVLWLRWLELRDSSQDAPPLNPELLREMARREDRIAQNHMGSVVLVKPGGLRMALFRAGHLGLGLIVRATATDGYLGSMRTIHFAHWVFVNNGSRLIFFSNFDHSWESYLDDFIEK